ncbi:MAG: hypothetical protein QM498_16130 [Desulfobacterium sp.]
MTDSLKKTYLIALGPVVLSIVIMAILEKGFSISLIPVMRVPIYFSPIVFVTAVLTALALPLVLRTLFARKAALEKKVDPASFFRFQRQLVITAMVTPYLGITALVLELQKFYVSATLLMALYAIYYYYPSQRRIDFDKRIFRIR